MCLRKKGAHLCHVQVPRSVLINPSAPARAVIHHVDAPTLFQSGRHMERAATARSRGSCLLRLASQCLRGDDD